MDRRTIKSVTLHVYTNLSGHDRFQSPHSKSMARSLPMLVTSTTKSISLR